MNKTRKRWTAEDEAKLQEELTKNNKLSFTLVTVSQATGHPVSTVSRHYYSNKAASTESQKTPVRWTEDEEQRLIRQVRAFPQNLNKCFLIVSEEINRTPCAVGAHWYAVTSKRPDVVCFFTASPQHISKNRKNGMGVESTMSVWRRLLRVIQTIIH